jgi:GT2 family glycosyltransferase
MNVFVIGPYGSGTSSVAQLLCCGGLYMGEPHELLPPRPANALEGWETPGLGEVNDDLLGLFGTDWRSAARLDVDTLPASLHERLHQRAVTWAARMASHGHWVGTDPRLCYTAGFWLQVLPEALIVLCVRHPEAAVAAMMQRQPCPFPDPESALAAWRRSFSGAAVDTTGRPRLVLDYDHVRTDPEGATDRLVAFCRAHIPHYIPPPDMSEQIASHLLPHMRHQSAASRPAIGYATHDVEGYEALLAADPGRLSRALRAFPTASLAFDIDRLVQFHRSEIAATNQSMGLALAAKDRHIDSLNAQLTARNTQLLAKDRYIATLEARHHQTTVLQQLTAWEVRSLKRSWSYRVGWILVRPGALLKRICYHLRRKDVILPALSGTVAPVGAVVETRAELTARYARLTARPLFSILTPVYNTPAALLRETLESVCNQVYEEWELCLVDDGSTHQETLEVLEEFRAREPARIKCARLPGNSGIAAASNAAARLATGAFLALLDHDDLLTSDALLEMALRLEQAPEADLLYSDEDKLTMSGEVVEPFYKPDFSPELFLTNNYLCHCSVIRTSVFWDVGGFHEGVDGSQDFDLFLRVTEVARRVEHVPRILYHWRMVPGSTAVDSTAKGGPWRESSRQALRAAVARRNWQAEVMDGLLPGTYRVKFAVDPTEHVSIIIPTKDKLDLLRVCIDSIRQHTDHPSYEILVISNNSEQQETYAYLEQTMREGTLRFLRHDIPFNYAALNNFAVRHCDSPYLLFLNNDTEVGGDACLTAMLEFAQQPDIGAVGAKLLYPDNTIQHAGVILGLGGVAGHNHRYLPEHHLGYFGQHNLVRNYSAVTAACLLTRREVFDAVGGFNEELAVAFNDVDFCLKIREAGYRIVYTPYARLYHYESASRGSDHIPENTARFRAEIAYILARWGAWLQNDPYYNPNLTPWREDFSLKTPADVAEQQAFLRSFPSLGHSAPQTPGTPPASSHRRVPVAAMTSDQG